MVAARSRQRELFGGLRSAKGVALRQVASQSSQLMHDRVVLDTFGHHLKAQATTHLDRPPYNLGLTCAWCQAADEAPVDFELVRR